MHADVTPRPPNGERGPNTHWKSDGRPKVGYGSRHIAEVNGRRIRGRGGPVYEAYRCGECPGWHLTTSRRRTLP